MIQFSSLRKYKEIDLYEEERCGGLWRPSKLSEQKDYNSFFYFKHDELDSLYKFLTKKKYEIGIQGGMGIVSKEIINLFNIGILNFHPGDLPLYRGSSAPEWQLIENKKIVCTCHFIDEGIDTGPILNKKPLNVNLESYYHMRASIYPLISEYLVEILNSINNHNDFIKENLRHQSKRDGKTRKKINKELLQILKQKLKKN